MRIADRAKDLIKSGGEWISSVNLENAVKNYYLKGTYSFHDLATLGS